MRTNERSAFIVGLVIIVCAAGGAWMVAKVGRIQEALQDRQKVEVIFENAKGVKIGAPVLYSGVNVGTVNSIEVERKDSSESGESPFQVRIILDVLDDESMPITYEDKVMIYVPFAMGDPDIRIYPMGGEEEYRQGNPLEGKDIQSVAQMQEILTETMKELQFTVKTITQLGIAELLAENKIADRIANMWWKRYGDSGTPEEVMAKWKAFVQEQKEISGSLMFADPKHKDGPPWKQEEIKEWRNEYRELKDRYQGR